MLCTYYFLEGKTMLGDFRTCNLDRKTGLSQCDIKFISLVLDDFMAKLNDDVYDGRSGTIIMDAQPTIAAKTPLIIKDEHGNQRPCIRNITYGNPVLLLKMHFLSGRAKSIFFDSEQVAIEAIDSLLEGKRLFYGHANASLNGNIYKTSGGGKTYESGHLMILNTSFGRFLVGCGDIMADQDKLNQCDYIFVALARTLVHMFPKDEELHASYDWIRSYSNINYYHFELVAKCIDEIFASDKRYLREYQLAITEALKSGKLQEPLLPFV